MVNAKLTQRLVRRVRFDHRSPPNVRFGSNAAISFLAGLNSYLVQIGDVSSATRRHVELVLRDAVKDCTESLDRRLQAMYSDHSAKGRLQSGATVRVAIRTMEEMALKAVERASSDTLEITRDQEAHVAFRAAMSDLLEFFRDQMPTVVRMANGRTPSERDSSIKSAADELFVEMESKIERKIEIAGFKFDASEMSSEPAALRAQMKAGRPRSAFWDDMWASIAFDLYDGLLKPRTQAEIEQAMLNWIEQHGQSAATSSVRARARRLWDLIVRGE